MSFLKSSDEILGKLVKSFSDSCSIELLEVKAATGGTTFNARNQSIWDVRNNRFVEVAKELKLKPVHIKRTSLWESVAVLNEFTGELFLFFRENTYKKILKEIGKKPYHYLDCLLSKNRKYDYSALNAQETLFDNPDYENFRETLSKELLGNDYDKVKTVIIFTLEEAKGITTGVNAILLSSKGDLVDAYKLTSFVSTNYSESAALNEEYEDAIVKLKVDVTKNENKIQGIRLLNEKNESEKV